MVSNDRIVRRQHEARQHRIGRRLVEVGLAGAQHLAPARRRRRDADAEEGERRLEQDRDRGQHHAPAPGSGSRHWAGRCGTCCRLGVPPKASTAVTKSRSAQREHLGPGHAREARDAGDADRDEGRAPGCGRGRRSAPWRRGCSAGPAARRRRASAARRASRRRSRRRARSARRSDAAIGDGAGRGQERGPRAVDDAGRRCRGRVRRCRTNAPRTGPRAAATRSCASGSNGEPVREERGEHRHREEERRSPSAPLRESNRAEEPAFGRAVTTPHPSGAAARRSGQRSRGASERAGVMAGATRSAVPG